MKISFKEPCLRAPLSRRQTHPQHLSHFPGTRNGLGALEVVGLCTGLCEARGEGSEHSAHGGFPGRLSMAHSGALVLAQFSELLFGPGVLFDRHEERV